MGFEFVDSYWLDNASEDELRATESDMMSELSKMDYDSEEYLELDLKRIDVVNAISNRFSFVLPKRKHGWYLPNDED